LNLILAIFLSLRNWEGIYSISPSFQAFKPSIIMLFLKRVRLLCAYTEVKKKSENLRQESIKRLQINNKEYEFSSKNHG
jgi:hypothetical protein